MSGFLYGGLTKPLSRADSFRIWDAAWDVGIRAFDTAEGYGACAERLETWLQEREHFNGHVSTKVTAGAGLGLRAAGAHHRFSGIAHTTTLLHGLGSEADWDILTRSVGAAGMSVYTAPEIATAIARRPLRMQIPISALPAGEHPPLDLRRVFDDGRLCKRNDPTKLIRQALAKLQLRDRLVIGVDTPEQIEAIVRALA